MKFFTFKGFPLVFFTLLVATDLYAADCLNRMTLTVPPGAVVNQPDGDTFHLFTVGVPNTVRIRVHGVDTPEKPTKTTPSPGWLPAKEFTKEWLARGPFTITTCGDRTIDRIVYHVERNGVSLADELILHGHGKP